MLKNVNRFFESCFQDEKGLPPTEEEEFVIKNEREIQIISEQLNSKEGQRNYNYEIRELSGGFKSDFSTTETFAQFQQGEIGGFTWNKRHIQFCDTFLVLMELTDYDLWYGDKDHSDDLADYIFLCDTSFKWIRLSKSKIMLENRSRKLTIDIKDNVAHWNVIKCLHALQRNFKLLNPTEPNAVDGKNENESFSPVRHNIPCRWLVCGQPYMEAVADAMERASDRIMIADWQLSPCVYLKRPWCETDKCFKPDDFWRLDNILKRKAESGVRIYILIYQDPAGLGLGNYEATKFFRRFTRKTDEDHGNVFTLTHPDMDGPVLWAHHEKMVVIDEKIAFVSGIDLARGRWEIHKEYPIFDNKLVKTFPGNDYWNQFNTKPADNVVVCQPAGDTIVADGWKTDRLDRDFETRSPWHDIGTVMKGSIAHDVGRHFIERWNACIYQCFKSAVKLKTPGLRRFRIPAMDGSTLMTKQVMVPRLLREVFSAVQRDYTPIYPAPTHIPSPGAADLPMIPMAGQNFSSPNPSFSSPNPSFSSPNPPFQMGNNQWNENGFPNMAYTEDGQSNHMMPEYPPLPGTNISYQSSNSYVGPKNDDYHTVSIQVLRSADTWSAGIGECENSIFRTYQHLIEHSKRYVYVENQFFVTTTDETGENRVKNKIGLCLAKRIVQAHENKEQFKIYVVIPCVPGMNGRLELNTAAGQEVIIHLTFESICRTDYSIKSYCEANGVPDWTEYIYFASFRTACMDNEKAYQEIVYPHSKLMIVDDEHTIIGSSNINDRSMLGERDSEVAVVIHGIEYAQSLRIRIWSVAMGKTEIELRNPAAEPSTDDFFKKWVDLAKQNFQIYDDIFCVLPNDEVWSMPDASGIEDTSEDYKKWKARYDERPAITNPEYTAENICKIQGTLVAHPLDFLKEETKINTIQDLLKNPSVGLSKEGLAQWLTGHLFE